MRHRFPAHQTSLVEQPLVFSVKLLERIVRQHGGTDAAGDRQHERVTASYRASRGRDQFVVRHPRIEFWTFRRVDAMPEGGVDHHGDLSVGVQLHERGHRFIELGKAGHLPAFGCDIGAVDHNVVRGDGVTHVLMPSFPVMSDRRSRAER